MVSKETLMFVAKRCWVAAIGAIVPLAPVDSKELLLICWDEIGMQRGATIGEV